MVFLSGDSIFRDALNTCIHSLLGIWVIFIGLVGTATFAANGDPQSLLFNTPYSVKSGTKRPDSDEVWIIKHDQDNGAHILIHNKPSNTDSIVNFEKNFMTDGRTALDLTFPTHHQDDAKNSVFLVFSNGRQIQVFRFFLNDHLFQDASLIFETPPLLQGEYSRAEISFSPDNTLYVRIDAETPTALDETAQQNDLRGKILRINADGSIPADNPHTMQVNGEFSRHPAVWSAIHQAPFNADLSSGDNNTTLDNTFNPAENFPSPPQASLGLSEYLLPQGEWHLISLPAHPGDHSTVASVFGDDISGRYGFDWILYRFDSSTGNYINPGENGRLLPASATG